MNADSAALAADLFLPGKMKKPRAMLTALSG
jgi:hypothetical protein